MQDVDEDETTEQPTKGLKEVNLPAAAHGAVFEPPSGSMPEDEVVEHIEVDRQRQLADVHPPQGIDDAFLLLDHDGRFAYVSKEAERFLQRNRESLLGKKAVEEYPGSDAVASLLRNCSEAIPLQTPVSLEEFHSASNRWLELRAYPSEGGLAVYLGDKTRQKSNDDALTEATQSLQGLIQALPLAIMVLDLAEKITVWNRAAERIFGWQEHEVIGRSLPFVPESEQNDFRGLRERVLRGEWLTNVERRRQRKDGSIIDISLSTAPMLDANGKMVGTMALAADITERKRAEAVQRRQENEFRSLMEQASDGILVHETGGKFATANSKICEMLGYTRDELRQLGPLDIIPKEDLASNPYPVDDLLAGKTVRRERRLLRKDGTTLPVENSARMIDDGRIQVFIRDITERKRAEEEREMMMKVIASAAAKNTELLAKTRRHLDRVVALRQIDAAITASLDLRVTASIILDQLVAQLGVDAAALLIFDRQMQTLGYLGGRGFRSTAVASSSLRLGEGYAGRAALERRVVIVSDLAEGGKSPARRALLAGERFVSYSAAPLIAKGQLKGVIEVFNRTPLAPDPEWIDLLETFAAQAAIAVDNIAMFEDLQRSNNELALAYDTTIEGWSRALDLRDKETEGHAQRVAEITVHIARQMGIGEEELVHVRRGALLHDIGKMGVPDSILLKPGPLTDEEWAIMRKHPVYAYELLSPIAYLRPALGIPYCHHERWNGTGYPRGLVGEAIPLAARAFAVVDIWDALRSERPYRPTWPADKVREYISSISGTHIDPECAQVFLRLEA